MLIELYDLEFNWIMLVLSLLCLLAETKTFYCPLQYPLRLVFSPPPSFHILENGLGNVFFGENLPLSEVKMGAYYINYYFHNIEYDDGFYGGEFSAPDYRVYCKFLYDRETKEFIDIWDLNCQSKCNV